MDDKTRDDRVELRQRGMSRRLFLDRLARVGGSTAAVASLPWYGHSALARMLPRRATPLTGLASDVLVVGGGLAGSSAALRAARTGVRVVLLERGGRPLGEGNTLMATGALGAGGSLGADPDTLYRRIMSEGVAHADLARAFATTCPEATDWLEGCGVAVTTRVGRRTLGELRALFEQAGGTTMMGVEAIRLISEDGRVRGVVAKRGAEVADIRSRSTILAAGGFSANEEMLRQHVGPRAAHCRLWGASGCTGDSLRMALDVGAKSVNLKYFYGHILPLQALGDDWRWTNPRLGRLYAPGILIDRTGNRFVDEGRGAIAASNELAWSTDPSGSTLIFDQQAWENAQTASFGLPPPNPYLAKNGVGLEAGVTAEELARTLGLDALTLKRTLETFNQSAEAGRFPSVPRTGKPRPIRGRLYGLRIVPGILFTMGGPLINGRAEVLDSAEEPIPGLYAAGDAIGGLMGGYRGGYHSGLTQAAVTGVLAGDNAARYTERLGRRRA